MLLDQGKLEEALAQFQRVLAIFEETLGPRHVKVATALASIGRVLMRQGQLEEALTYYQRAVAILEEAWGPHHPRVVDVLVEVARVTLAKRDFDAAREHAERAVSICESSEVEPNVVAGARFMLAQALWSDLSQRARAHALAEQAHDAFAELGDTHQKDLTEVELWLAGQRVP